MIWRANYTSNLWRRIKTWIVEGLKESSLNVMYINSCSPQLRHTSSSRLLAKSTSFLLEINLCSLSLLKKADSNFSKLLKLQRSKFKTLSPQEMVTFQYSASQESTCSMLINWWRMFLSDFATFQRKYCQRDWSSLTMESQLWFVSKISSYSWRKIGNSKQSIFPP